MPSGGKKKNTLLWWVLLSVIVGAALYYGNVKSTPTTATDPSSDVLTVNETQFLQLAAGEYPGATLRAVHVDRTGHELKITVDVKVPSGKYLEKKTTVYIGFEYSRELAETLKKNGVRVTVDSPSDSGWKTFLFEFGPIILMIVFFVWLMRRQAGGGAGGAMTFAKSRHKSQKSSPVNFADVAGCDEAKEELVEIIQFLKDPAKFRKLGARIPKGVLLMGPPGNGKTLLAKAVAGEANVPFLSISGSDFVEMFVGVGAARVRDLFAEGKKCAPCIVFIDEIDAIGKSRGSGIGGGNDEREQTLNAILVEMDGFDTSEGVIVIAATNRSDVLDEALIRPGRFDRQVMVPLPDLIGREAILKVHAKKIKLDPAVDLMVMARMTPGACGADLANLINEAALHASRHDHEFVTQADFEEAFDKVFGGGRERKSTVMSPEEKRVTAWHEAGHTLVGEVLYKEDPKNADPNHKVSIIPRGQALGFTMQLPVADRYQYTKRYLMNRLTVLMGGRAAEEALCKLDGQEGNYTGGCSDDISRATDFANKMVRELGMDDTLGPRTFGRRQQLMFLGREVDQQQDFSDVTANRIDDAVNGIISKVHTRARDILTTHRDKLTALAIALLERETLSAADITAICWGAPENSVPLPDPPTA